MTDELRRAFDAAVGAGYERGHVLGRIGRKNANGSISIQAERDGFLYVTLSSDASQAVDVAFNAAVRPIYNLPVKMRRIGGHLVIVGLNDDPAMLGAFLGGSPPGAPAHNHLDGSGLEYEHPAFWFSPGRVLWSGTGVTVRLRDLHYRYNGAEKYWPGGTLDLTSNLPATANKWAWIVVGVNPATNAAVAVTGALYDAQADLTAARIADVDMLDHIPLGAVQAKNGDTSLSARSRYADARHWLDERLRLDDLTNATITTPVDQGVLLYDQTSGDWIDGPPKSDTTHAHASGDLSDVDTTGVSDHDVLQYSGGSWISQKVALIVGFAQLREIIGGVITVSNRSNYKIYAEGGLGPDDLDTITPLPDPGAIGLGHIIILRRQSSIPFVAKHGTGNLNLRQGDCVFDSDAVTLTLLWVQEFGVWIEMARNNAAGGGSYVHPNHTGDVTSVGDGATTIANNAVTLAKIQQIQTQRLLGRNTAATGNVEELSALPTNIDSLYALLGGRAGGQTLSGGTAASENAIINSTAHATKGEVKLANDGGRVTFRRAAAGAHDVHIGGSGIQPEVVVESNAGRKFGVFVKDAGEFVQFGAVSDHAFNIMTNSVSRMRFASGANAGNLGIFGAGVSPFAPQGGIHFHDGTTGFLLHTISVTSGTSVTVIPDGAGDVLQLLHYEIIVKPSTGSPIFTTSQRTPGAGDNDLWNTGTDILRIRVTSGGAVQVQRTAGTLSYSLSLRLFWM